VGRSFCKQASSQLLQQRRCKTQKKIPTAVSHKAKQDDGKRDREKKRDTGRERERERQKERKKERKKKREKDSAASLWVD
jgi:hypothetical protein